MIRRWPTRLLLPAAALIVAASTASTTMTWSQQAARKPAPSGRPAAQQVKVLTYNVAGAVRDEKGRSEHDDGYGFLLELASRIQRERPQIVTLQEVCASQIRYLLTLTSGYPLRLASAPTVPAHKEGDKVDQRDPFKKRTNRCPGGEENEGFGTAILTVGPASEVPVNGGARLRCVDWTTAGRVRVCTVHIDPVDIGLVASTAERWVDTMPVIVTGDFNARPGTVEAGRMYSRNTVAAPESPPPGTGRFYEVAMCPGADCGRVPPVVMRGGPPTFCKACTPDGIGLQQKIDYIFVDDRHFAPRMTSRVMGTDPRDSDHRMLLGSVTLKRPVGHDTRPGFAALAGTWEHQGSFPTDVASLSIDENGVAVYNAEGLQSRFRGQVVHRGGRNFSVRLTADPAREDTDHRGLAPNETLFGRIRLGSPPTRLTFTTANGVETFEKR